MHGKSSQIKVLGGKIFADLPTCFAAGRYHSLYANKATLPARINHYGSNQGWDNYGDTDIKPYQLLRYNFIQNRS